MKILLGNPNRKITATELAKIRTLDDFDLVMLISEIHDHGWAAARDILDMMREGKEKEDHDPT